MFTRKRKFRFWSHADQKLYDWDWCLGNLELGDVSVGGMLQWTGEKDIDDKEIYEGDILEDKDGFLSIVTWAEYRGKFVNVSIKIEKDGTQIDNSIDESYPPTKQDEKLVVDNIFENKLDYFKNGEKTYEYFYKQLADKNNYKEIADKSQTKE